MDIKNSDVPPSFPVSQKDFFEPLVLGQGSRMTIYPAYTGKTVLRVPKNTEKNLVQVSGKSGVFATKTKDHPVSTHTIQEVEQYEKLKGYLGQFTVGVIPFQDFDQNGDLRTYSTQRFINKSKDLLNLELFSGDLNDKTKRRLRLFVEDIRQMILEGDIVPDLVGHGNAVLDQKDNVWLIDINNIRPMVSNENWAKPEFKNNISALRSAVLMQCRDQMNRVFHPDYLDDQNYPMADMSLERMKNWELNLGMQTPASVEKDEIYSKYLLDPLRQEISSLICTTIRRSGV